MAGVKSFGGFLYSAVNKAGAKVSEAGAKIKKTVEENVSCIFNLIFPLNIIYFIVNNICISYINVMLNYFIRTRCLFFILKVLL